MPILTAFTVMVKKATDRGERVHIVSCTEAFAWRRGKKELKTVVKNSAVQAVSRRGISPSALMRMAWVVPLTDGGQLEARLVVQGFTDQGFGNTPTSSPNASNRSRQIFLKFVAFFGFQTHQGDVECACLQGDLDVHHVDKDDDANFKIDSAQLVSDTFCEPVPELSRKLQ